MGCFQGFHSLLELFSEGSCDRLLSHMPARSCKAATGMINKCQGRPSTGQDLSVLAPQEGLATSTLSSVSCYKTKVALPR